MGQKTKTKEDYEKQKKEPPSDGGFQPAKPWTDYRARRPAAPGSEPGSGYTTDPRPRKVH